MTQPAGQAAVVQQEQGTTGSSNLQSHSAPHQSDRHESSQKQPQSTRGATSSALRRDDQSSQRVSFAVGAAAIILGAALWSIGSEPGAEQAVSVIGALSALVVIGATLYNSLYGLNSRVSKHDISSLLPLGGLLLVGLSAICRLFIGESEFSPQGYAAPLLLGGVYVLLRGLSRRGWSLAGIGWTPLFPPGDAQVSVLVPGEKVHLQRDSVVPVDVRISSGSVAVQERYLSPVSLFRVKDEAEVLYAGSTVTGGSAEAIALSDSKGSCLRRLEAAVSEALGLAEGGLVAKDEAITRFAAYAALFLAVAAAIFWNERGVSPVIIPLAAGLVLYAATIALAADLIYSASSRLVRDWAHKGFVLLSRESFDVLAAVKEVAFDPGVVFASRLCNVKEFEILDDRINRKALCSTLASFLGRADDVGFVALGNHCASVSPFSAPERVLDLREYEGLGVCGSIKGVEFSIGTEGFLVERGIMMQPSDGSSTVADHERVLLVAIDSDVIARCVLSFGQQALVSDNSVDSAWDDLPDTIAKLAPLDQREFSEGVLLVRGAESTAIGRSHAYEVASLGKDSLRPPQGATVLSLTADYSALSELLRDCREHQKWAGLCRALVAAAGIVAVASVFVGFTSIWVPLVLIPLITVLVLL